MRAAMTLEKHGPGDGRTHVQGASPGLALQVPGRHWRYEPPPQVLVSPPEPPQHSCHGVVEPPPHTEELPQPQLPLCWLPIGSMPHLSAAGQTSGSEFDSERRPPTRA